MIDVFVSRPNWVSASFVKGLDGFLGFLKSIGLNPRTIGATDYPRISPLDEVIRLLDQCSGAVILGYPQIIANSGTVKDKPISGLLLLPTEWNHIEAGLAYARDIPLLVIHHTGVYRGIFDRGAIAHFIYELDLQDPSWPLADNIRGVLESWKRDVLNKPRASTKQKTNRENESTGVLPDISEDHINILKFIADSGDHYPSDAEIAHRFNMSLEKGRYFLGMLLNAKLIGDLLTIGSPTEYYTTQEGRGFLVKRGLL